jgi:hypothetical protein
MRVGLNINNSVKILLLLMLAASFIIPISNTHAETAPKYVVCNILLPASVCEQIVYDPNNNYIYFAVYNYHNEFNSRLILVLDASTFSIVKIINITAYLCPIYKSENLPESCIRNLNRTGILLFFDPYNGYVYFSCPHDVGIIYNYSIIYNTFYKCSLYKDLIKANHCKATFCKYCYPWRFFVAVPNSKYVYFVCTCKSDICVFNLTERVKTIALPKIIRDECQNFYVIYDNKTGNIYLVCFKDSAKVRIIGFDPVNNSIISNVTIEGKPIPYNNTRLQEYPISSIAYPYEKVMYDPRSGCLIIDDAYNISCIIFYNPQNNSVTSRILVTNLTKLFNLSNLGIWKCYSCNITIISNLIYDNNKGYIYGTIDEVRWGHSFNLEPICNLNLATVVINPMNHSIVKICKCIRSGFIYDCKLGIILARGNCIYVINATTNNIIANVPPRYIIANVPCCDYSKLLHTNIYNLFCDLGYDPGAKLFYTLGCCNNNYTIAFYKLVNYSKLELIGMVNFDYNKCIICFKILPNGDIFIYIFCHSILINPMSICKPTTTTVSTTTTTSTTSTHPTSTSLISSTVSSSKPTTSTTSSSILPYALIGVVLIVIIIAGIILIKRR